MIKRQTNGAITTIAIHRRTLFMAVVVAMTLGGLAGCKKKSAIDEAVANVDTTLPEGKVDLHAVDVTEDEDFNSENAGILGIYRGMPIGKARKVLEKNDRLIVEQTEREWDRTFKYFTAFIKEGEGKGVEAIEVMYNPRNEVPQVLAIEVSMEFVPSLKGRLGKLFASKGLSNIKDWLGPYDELSDDKDSTNRQYRKRGLRVTASGTTDDPNGSLFLER